MIFAVICETRVKPRGNTESTKLEGAEGGVSEKEFYQEQQQEAKNL